MAKIAPKNTYLLYCRWLVFLRYKSKITTTNVASKPSLNAKKAGVIKSINVAIYDTLNLFSS
jgi:hypothetical protein